MRRRRRFPLISTLVMVALSVTIGFLTYYDRNVPSRAMYQVGDAIKAVGRSLSSMLTGETAGTGGGLFASGGATSIGGMSPVLVNADHPLPDGYAPRSLVRLAEYCDPAIVTVKEDGIEGEKEAVDALMVMLSDAILQGQSNWQISAGYRSVAYQQKVWDDYVRAYENDGLSAAQAQSATAKYVAQPGFSEHHTGLAFDVTVPGESFATTEQSVWLADNCWDYGFIIRYTEDKVAITGINAEPWHIRYVGKQHARAMRDSGQCLEEYLQATGFQ